MSSNIKTPKPECLKPSIFIGPTEPKISELNQPLYSTSFKDGDPISAQFDQAWLQTTKTDEVVRATKFKFEAYLLEILDSVNFDKEEMLHGLIEKSGLTPEEFGVYYILEEHPIEIITEQSLDFASNTIRVTQEFKVRPKTDEEMQLALEQEQQGEN